MLSRYLQELNKVQLLSPDEERRLWKLYKEEGDKDARQDLITAYQPLVYKLVTRLTVSNDLVMDLIQEGIIGLIEAVENYEPSRRARFSTYATYRIRGRVLNYLNRDLKLDLDLISLDQPFEEEGLSLLEKLAQKGLSLEGQVEEKYLQEELHGAIQRLSPKEQEIVKELLFIESDAKEVARKMDISQGHLYRLQRKAIKRIRGMLSGLIREIKGA